MVRVSTVNEGGGVYVYKVECLALGETSVTLRQVASVFSHWSLHLKHFQRPTLLSYGVGTKRWLSKRRITYLRWYKTSKNTKSCKFFRRFVAIDVLYYLTICNFDTLYHRGFVPTSIVKYWDPTEDESQIMI